MNDNKAERENVGVVKQPILPPGYHVPAGLKSRALRTSRYILTLGVVRGGWLSLREAFGDRRETSVSFNGRKLSIRLGTSDILVLYSVFVREDYGVNLSPPPATIIDAGAYIGFSAIYFAEMYPDSTILTLEPEPSNFALLVRNVASYLNIIPLNQALWYRNCRLDLYDPGTGHWAFYVTPEASHDIHPRAQVEAVSVSTLMKRFNFERVDLLKIDVEGAEKEIFDHASEWIVHVEAIFAELHDRLKPGCTEAFTRAVSSFRRVFSSGMTAFAIKGTSVPSVDEN